MKYNTESENNRNQLNAIKKEIVEKQASYAKKRLNLKWMTDEINKNTEKIENEYIESTNK